MWSELNTTLDLTAPNPIVTVLELSIHKPHICSRPVVRRRPALTSYSPCPVILDLSTISTYSKRFLGNRPNSGGFMAKTSTRSASTISTTPCRILSRPLLQVRLGKFFPYLPFSASLITHELQNRLPHFCHRRILHEPPASALEREVTGPCRRRTTIPRLRDPYAR